MQVRAKVEEEVVLALAEVVDAYAREGSGWETDFKRSVEGTGAEEGEHLVRARGNSDLAQAEDPLALAILVASQCASLIAPQRLQALPLPVSLLCRSASSRLTHILVGSDRRVDDDNRTFIPPRQVS